MYSVIIVDIMIIIKPCLIQLQNKGISHTTHLYQQAVYSRQHQQNFLSHLSI